MNKLYTIILLLSFAFSCSQNQKTKIDLNNEDLSYMTVTLVDGELWQTNEDTRLGISNMLNIVQSYNGDNKLLKDELEQEFQSLFQKCTMTGEAHNQLHNYLFPLVDFFDNILLEDQKLMDDNIRKLEIHLLAFDLYFN